MRVVKAYVWRHISGRTVSVGGAVPYHSAAECTEWEMIQVGWTIQHADGTRGIGRVPFTTQEDAQAWINAHPRFRGMSS